MCLKRLFSFFGDGSEVPFLVSWGHFLRLFNWSSAGHMPDARFVKESWQCIGVRSALSGNQWQNAAGTSVGKMTFPNWEEGGNRDTSNAEKAFRVSEFREILPRTKGRMGKS